MDAMAICREFRKFDLFITITGNPQWKSIKENIFPGQQSSDRPDIMNRVMHEVVKSIMTDLKDGALGPAKAWLHVIEGQMRGLKHAHILLLLALTLSLEDVDRCINAQIPDKDTDPELYDAIGNFMLHGPCGPGFASKCMEKGVCTKGYPKPFQETTILPPDGHGYPLYARPDNKRYILKNGFMYDNRWVVPHNRWLLLKYQCHINVEFVGSFSTVKYVFKYVNKGVDLATMSVEGPKDEIKQFVNARYIDPHDAVWRLCKFPIQERFPAVYRLAIHDDGQQNILFKEGKAEEALADSKMTTLLAWFETNKRDPDARTIKYQDFPKYYTFAEGKWRKRKHSYIPGVNRAQSIGRIYSATPSQGNRFYIRLLLNHITGATCYQSLRTHNGVIYNTYKECAEAMGILADDKEWVSAMQEASVHAMPCQLRATFAVILQYCSVTSPNKLWDEFKADLAEDILYNEKTKHGITQPNLEVIHNEVLILIDTELGQMGSSLAEIEGMPKPDYGNRLTREYRIIEEERFDVDVQATKLKMMEPMLNSGQLKAYNTILNSVYNADSEHRQFVIDSPGGFGKTFLFQTLCANIRSKGDIVLCVASTGLAAQNLEGGRTAHARFKIPIQIDEDSTCNITAQSALAELIKQTRLIIWDEVFSISKLCLEAVERSVADIINNGKPWGGLAIVCGGDTRQTLPVVKHGGRPHIVNSVFKSSKLFSQFHKISLKTNMRTAPEEIEFSKYLLRLGEGVEHIHEDHGPNKIKLPEEYLVGTKEDLISAIFPDLMKACINSRQLIDNAIYTPLNKNMSIINEMCLEQFPGDERGFLSADSILEADQQEAVPTEFLNSLTMSGMPDHHLRIKVGCPVMLIRNLQSGPGSSLRNGTRMIVRNIMHRVVECEVAVGESEGKRVFLPRIPHYDKSADFPFTVVRRQFPIRLAWCITINKGM